MKLCILDADKVCDNCLNCRCTRDPNKVCDNCFQCLEDKEEAYAEIPIAKVVTQADEHQLDDAFIQSFVHEQRSMSDLLVTTLCGCTAIRRKRRVFC